MHASRTALRFVSAAAGVSLAISALTACGDNSTSNSGAPIAPRTTWTNNVFYHNGQYYCVYPFGARELCSYAVGPDDLSIAEENWIEAKEPGNYSPDSNAFASVVWSMYLLNLDWFDDIIDDVYKGTKKAKYKSSLKSKLAQSKKANRDDLKKVNSGSWTPPASPAAPKSKTPKGDKNKGTKDCAFGAVNSGVELAAYPALTNGGSSGSRNGSSGNRNATNGGTGNQNNTNGGNANGGNANGSVSSGQTGGTGTEKLPDNNQQQPRNNGC